MSNVIDFNYTNLLFGNGKPIHRGIYRFVSSIKKENEIESDYLAFYNDMDLLGQSVEIGSDTDLRAEPYSDLMIPVNDISVLKKASKVVIIGMNFFAYNAIDLNSENQDQNVNNAIIDSLSDLTGAYNATHFRHTMPLTHMNNFFNPIFKINNTNILNNTMYSNSGNKGLFSIGSELPYKYDLYHLIDGSVNSIQLNAMAGQIVNVNDKMHFKRYPLACDIFVQYTT